MKNKRVEVGDVIILNHKALRGSQASLYFSSYGFLLEHNPWIVRKVMHWNTLRIGSLDGKVAMSGNICLEARLDEYTVDKFLSAVNKAGKK